MLFGTIYQIPSTRYSQTFTDFMVIAELFVNFVVGFIEKFQYLGIFVLMALESANIPIPSEIIMPFSGYLVFQGKLSLMMVVAMGALGNLLGSILSYFLGAQMGRPFVLKYGKYFLIPEKEFLMAEGWFLKYGKSIIFFSRILPVIRTFISLPAGVAKMDFMEFVLYTLAGCVIWSAFLAYVGIWLGPSWEVILAFFNKLDILVIAGFVVFVIWYLRKFKQTS